MFEHSCPFQLRTLLSPWSLSIFLLFLHIPKLKADLGRHHQSLEKIILPGGRAALMGGAYTAISSDPAGLLYNPAGVSFCPQNQISLNTWSSLRSKTVYKEAVLGRDFEETSVTRFGGLVSGLFQYKPFTLGYLIATPDNRKINQDDTFTELSSLESEIKNFTRIHQETNTHDVFGLSLAVALGRSWSLGGIVMLYDRSIESMDYQLVEYNDGHALIQESKIKVSNQGLMSSVGISYKGDSLSLGLATRFGQPMLDQGRIHINTVSYPQSSSVPIITKVASDQYTNDSELIPALIRAGIAWHPTPYFLLSQDLAYSLPLSSNNTSPDRKGTWNYAIGMEIGPKALTLMLGAFTNNSIFPEINSEQTNQGVHVDYSGRSGGIAISGQGLDIVLGYVKQAGKGKAQIIAGSSAIQATHATLENFVLSWNFKLR